MCPRVELLRGQAARRVKVEPSGCGLNHRKLRYQLGLKSWRHRALEPVMELHYVLLEHLKLAALLDKKKVRDKQTLLDKKDLLSYLLRLL